MGGSDGLSRPKMIYTEGAAAAALLMMIIESAILLERFAAGAHSDAGR